MPKRPPDKNKDCTGLNESVQLEVRKLEAKTKSFLTTIHKTVLVNAIVSLALLNVCRDSLHVCLPKAIMKSQSLLFQPESRNNVG